MSILVGTGRGTRAGVLVKSAEALELFGRVDTLLLDKTGTITEGKPKLRHIEALAPDFSELEVLTLAASVEQASEHPLASAIVDAARERGASLGPVEGFEYRPGRGVLGTVNGARVVVGTQRLLAELDVPSESSGLMVAVNGRAVARLDVADSIRRAAAETLLELERDGLSLVMLTGDSRANAEAVSRELRVRLAVHAEMLPHQKAEFVTQLRGEGRRVAMAGDGINDAPALAAADVGIAMGSGTDVAIQSAGITLVSSELAALLRARRLSRAVMRNIRQNLGFAFAYNLLGVPVAAGVLYPAFGWLLSPMIASAAMAASSISVVANALRLRHSQV
ncbi:MAG: HAD-IC family P-type ATPase [Polyangiaceae bacterium]